MLKKLKLGLVALLLPLIAFAQSYPSPTFNNVTSQGTATLNNATVSGTFTATGKIGLASLAAQAANTVVSNVTASSASPTAVALPSCSTGNSALQYTSGTGFSCGTSFSLTSGTLAQFAATTSAQLAGVISDETGSGFLVFGTNPTVSGATISGGSINNTPIGATTASTGKFTTLQATSTLTGFTGRLLNVQVFTSGGTYTATTGTSFVIVDAVGAGGGGGGISATAAGQSAGAAGGSGGSFARIQVTSGFSGSTVTIGAAGAAGAAGGIGGTGGATSFGTFVSCPGGIGGSSGGAIASPIVGAFTASPAAPTVAGATTLFASKGNPSAMPTIVSVAGTSQIGGSGANGPFGAGAPGLTTSAAGTAASGFGAGGSGAGAGASQSALGGGAGSGGLVIVYEYSL